jgi:hypothetical protein
VKGDDVTIAHLVIVGDDVGFGKLAMLLPSPVMRGNQIENNPRSMHACMHVMLGMSENGTLGAGLHK